MRCCICIYKVSEYRITLGEPPRARLCDNNAHIQAADDITHCASRSLLSRCAVVAVVVVDLVANKLRLNLCNQRVYTMTTTATMAFWTN